MDRVLKALGPLGRPWDGPAWLLLVLISINRLLMDNSWLHGKKLAVLKIIPVFGSKLLSTFLLAFFLAASIMTMIKFLRTKPEREPSWTELLNITLTAQSSYLLAAPILLLSMAVVQYFGLDYPRSLSQFLNGLFPFLMYVILYVKIRRRFADMGELSMIGLVLSPYLLLVGSVFAGLAAIFLLASAMVVTAMLA
ncbi:MAG: hypothetical protein HYT79_07460 [Elusimicrobia bacterium]|nr:hypothetical protein [Elusimicrobiota bacterium]